MRRTTCPDRIKTRRDGDHRYLAVRGLRASCEPEPDHGRVSVQTAGLDIRGAHRVGDTAPFAVGRRRMGPLGWVKIGEVKAGRVDTLLAIDGGYLGWEATGEEGYPVARYPLMG